ncbi:MAG: GpE family phage tail protein [Acidobacteria bacterium]|nr:GpE family phage tail protein [Acidobacteriota bacterium]
MSADLAHLLHFSRESLLSMDPEELVTWHAEARALPDRLYGGEE